MKIRVYYIKSKTFPDLGRGFNDEVDVFRDPGGVFQVAAWPKGPPSQRCGSPIARCPLPGARCTHPLHHYSLPIHPTHDYSTPVGDGLTLVFICCLRSWAVPFRGRLWQRGNMRVVLCVASVALAVACGEDERQGSGPVVVADAGVVTPDVGTPDSGVGCIDHDGCSGALPFCEVATGACIEPPPGSELGWGDGSPESVTWTEIAAQEIARQPTDLEFDPSNLDYLWVVNRLDHSVLIIHKPGQDDVTVTHKRDPAASHFMNRPPALAFGVVLPQWGQSWGTCGDNNNGGNDFMGPTLFSADLDLFATQNNETRLGSHLDMLHSTTYCRGIAHVADNVYFAFNSSRKSLDRYDFGQDHGPGFDDHSDGIIHRFLEGQVEGVDNVSSHLTVDKDNQILYVADTGNQRIMAVDIDSGTQGRTFGGLEPVRVRAAMDNVMNWDVVPRGLLEAPSGIELHRGLIFVTDNATSRFYAFDMSGNEVKRLDTGLPPGSLSGFDFGPDGKIYAVDTLTARVLRLDPR